MSATPNFSEMFDPAKFAEQAKTMMPDFSALTESMEKANAAFVTGTTALMEQSLKLAEDGVKDSASLMTFEKDPKVFGETVAEISKKYGEAATVEAKTGFETISKMTTDMVTAMTQASAANTSKK